jgi:hypothetical protein
MNRTYKGPTMTITIDLSKIQSDIRKMIDEQFTLLLNQWEKETKAAKDAVISGSAGRGIDDLLSMTKEKFDFNAGILIIGGALAASLTTPAAAAAGIVLGIVAIGGNDFYNTKESSRRTNFSTFLKDEINDQYKRLKDQQDRIIDIWMFEHFIERKFLEDFHMFSPFERNEYVRKAVWTLMFDIPESGIGAIEKDATKRIVSALQDALKTEEEIKHTCSMAYAMDPFADFNRINCAPLKSKIAYQHFQEMKILRFIAPQTKRLGLGLR